VGSGTYKKALGDMVGHVAALQQCVTQTQVGRELILEADIN